MAGARPICQHISSIHGKDGMGRATIKIYTNGLRGFGQPMRNDIVSAAQLIPRESNVGLDGSRIKQNIATRQHI